jgi:chromosome segregation ATPase
VSILLARSHDPSGELNVFDTSISEVTVTLKNGGDDAYRPDIFGKRIHITRRFTIQGASSYKILSEAKAVISNRKADLDDICDHMSIQVDNPLNVLTQGSSFSNIRNAY